MPIYTVTDSLLKADLDKKYICDILMYFTLSNPYKVALDSTNKIMNLYEDVGSKNEFIATWLVLMSMKPSSFEFINVDASGIQNDEELFLKVCSSTKSQQKIIIDSHEDWMFYSYTEHAIILYNGISVFILDKEEAVADLNPEKNTIYAVNSVVATGNASIDNTKNKN